MATTRESIADGFAWIAKIARIGLRRAVVIAGCAGLFAVLVIVTTRERPSDCGAVTEHQRTLLDELAGGASGLVVAEPSECRDGRLTRVVEGLPNEIESVTSQVVALGWTQETEYVAYFRQAWQRCFRWERDGWERIQLLVDADRRGRVREVVVAVPERGDACDLERRDESTIYPPRQPVRG